MILEKTIEKASKILKNYNINSHLLDAEVILSNIMKVKREYLLINNKMFISNKIKKDYARAIERRTRKEPVAYIIGKKEFWSRDFIVNTSTLIPRPETELLIYKLVDILKNKKIDILDTGTGSGCVLLSVLKELKYSKGIGIDISSKAIEIAKKNSKSLKLSNRCKFKVFDLNNYYSGKYNLIISNPPYIPLKDMKNLAADISNFEPLIALKGGVDGLDLIKKVIYKSNTLLKRDGLLALEIGNGQYHKVNDILKLNGYRELSKEYDYKNNVRCIISTKVKFF